MKNGRNNNTNSKLAHLLQIYHAFEKIRDVIEVKHSGKKGAKFDNIRKIFCIQRNRKATSMNDRNIVSHSEIFEVALNREIHLTNSLHQHPSPLLVRCTVLGRCAR